MGIPEGSFAIAAFIVVAIPGFIYAAVRRWARGESSTDRDVGLTIARGAVFAVALTAAYLLAVGDRVYDGLGPGGAQDTLVIDDPRRLGLTVLVFYIAIPAVISFVLNVRYISWRTPEWLHESTTLARVAFFWLRIPRSSKGHSSEPTSWDYATSANEDSWVAIRRANGDWFGGWYTQGSFVTTYPEPRGIYINDQYKVTKRGAFKERVPGGGIFLMINDDDTVFWTSPKRAEKQEEMDKHE
jgi:hypothetical protein